MLSIDVQKQIAKLLKIDENAFLEAVKSEKEAEVKIPEGIQVFTSQELITRDDNQKKLGYNEGKEAGLEIFVKEQKQKLGLDFEGKDPEKLISSLQTKVLADAKIEPNQKIKEKEEQIAKLQGTVQDFENKYKASEKEKAEMRTMGKLAAAVPVGLPFEADEVIMSMRTRGYSFDVDDAGNITPKKNGEVLRDSKTQNPLDHKAVINEYVTNERKWVVAEGEGAKVGRGEKSDRRTAGVVNKMSDAKAQWEAQGKSVNSADFQAFVANAAKDNKDFNWDE
jgi:hypothetical protein